MGQEAILFGLRGYEVHTFEPLREQYNNLQFNLKLNCVNAFSYNYGLGSQAGTLCIGQAELDSAELNSPGAHVLDMGRQDAACPPARKIQVTTLDLIITPQLNSRPVLLKIDCEGCEYRALQGSRELLTKYPPFMINREVVMSREKMFDDQIEFLHSFGYEIYFFGLTDKRVSEDYPLAYWSEHWKSRPIVAESDLAHFLVNSTAWELLAVHQDAKDLLGVN